MLYACLYNAENIELRPGIITLLTEAKSAGLGLGSNLGGNQLVSRFV
jgi:hypothetical protein